MYTQAKFLNLVRAEELCRRAVSEVLHRPGRAEVLLLVVVHDGVDQTLPVDAADVETLLFLKYFLCQTFGFP